MTLAQFANLLQASRQPGEVSAATEPLHCTELLVGCTARPHEVRVVGVGKAVRARARRGHNGALLEDEDGAPGPGKGEDARDRVSAFGVRDRMAAPVRDPQLHALLGGDACDEVRALRLGAAQFEVRCARPAEGTPTEKRAAQIRTAATGARDHPSRRTRERREARAQNSGLVQHLHRALVSCNMELVPRRTVERAPLVGTDLGGDAEPAQQAEGTACDRRVRHVEVKRDRAAAFQVNAARRVEQARELGEPIALLPRRDRGELVAEVLRE